MNPAEIAVLVAAILGPTGIWGVKELLGRRKAKEQPITHEDLQAPPQDPRIPQLEEKVGALTGLLGDLASRVDQLEKERDQAKRSRDEAQAQAELAAAYSNLLREHILKELPPPPPDWPLGWKLERTDL